MDWYDIIGLIGSLLIILAYLLVQLENMSASELKYSIFNGTGAALIIVSLCFKFNLSAFLVEFFWLLISILGIAKSIQRRKK
jgi:multidrug transporter EmrE-like cation transporter